jgi:hypothetical protein
MGKPTELLQGTLDLLILKTLALERMHGWGITLRIQCSRYVLAHSIQRSIASSTTAGLSRSGARRTPVGAPNTIR